MLWKSKNVKAMDSGNMNDLFARVFLEGEEHQESDTHWRCYAGKGSWNWRFKFQITLPIKTPEMGRINLQLWDKDVVKWNDCICSTTIDMCVSHEARCSCKALFDLPLEFLVTARKLIPSIFVRLFVVHHMSALTH